LAACLGPDLLLTTLPKIRREGKERDEAWKKEVKRKGKGGKGHGNSVLSPPYPVFRLFRRL